jgi:hypothetical protein
MEMGEYLHNFFLRSDLARRRVFGEKGLWTWLAYLWFDQLCPDKNPQKKYENYICTSDYRRYYRHLVATTYYIYDLHGTDNSRLFLECSLDSNNSFVEQLASRQDIITNKALIEVAHRFYWDARTNKPKRGAQSSKRPGNIRRFVTVADQLALTYDIRTTADEILTLFPAEFDYQNP